MRLMLPGLLLLITLLAQAKSFGVIGEVFPVAEKSFLTLIEERLQLLFESDHFKKLNQHWQNQIARKANRPNPLNLPRALKHHVHYYKPEVVLGNAIYDANGQVLYPTGTTVNALSQLLSYKPCWLFFNADEKAQLNWAKKALAHCINAKLILTSGAINHVERLFQRVVYFDQGGRITQKLAIQSLPTKVTRKNNLLRIDEQAIKENGDVM